eukprot:TRINITY_DN10443_c0_g1_i1.p1 TRINITY_DN10443_c0_g1~~TRINITY_DN10443_c0_g1_i1.p1  ORF type:complete len:131 (+),score=1.86 TRINITY_DN10443_c0_g1_i1:535-927(+)
MVWSSCRYCCGVVVALVVVDLLRIQEEAAIREKASRHVRASRLISTDLHPLHVGGVLLNPRRTIKAQWGQIEMQREQTANARREKRSEDERSNYRPSTHTYAAMAGGNVHQSCCSWVQGRGQGRNCRAAH